MLFKIFACITMTAIAYQDFKYRAIHWLLFLFISIFLTIDGLKTISFTQYILNISFNILLIFLQFALLYLYYFFQGKNLKSIFFNIIGEGDILFIVILSLAFSWHSFLFYYILGLLFSVITWLLLKYSGIIHSELIPFAGLMAIFCTLLLIIEIIVPDFERFSDGIFKLFLNG